MCIYYVCMYVTKLEKHQKCHSKVFVDTPPPPPLGVKNVKIESSEKKIRGPIGTLSIHFRSRNILGPKH